MQHTFSIIIPVYNGTHLVEGCLNQIAETSERIFSKIEKVIVVNDGSCIWDISEDLIKKKYERNFEVTFLHHPKNKGKGAAVRTGLAEISQGHALMLDVDGATQVESIIDLISVSEQNPHTMICGSRYGQGSKILKSQKKWRTQAGRFGSLITHAIFSIPVQDTQCGAKIFPPKLTKTIARKGKSNRWAADIEWFILAQKQNTHIKVVPVVWKDGEESQVRPWHFITTAFDIIVIKLRVY